MSAGLFGADFYWSAPLPQLRVLSVRYRTLGSDSAPNIKPNGTFEGPLRPSDK